MTTYGAKELANSFRTVRKNTIQVAQDIPEDKYDYVAAPGVKPVSLMLCHVAVATGMWEEIHGKNRHNDMGKYDFNAMFQKFTEAETKKRSKAEIVKLLESDGERFASFLEGLSNEFLAERVTMPFGQGEKSRFEMLLSAKEHEMHHRAQLMLVERQLGIVPHLTRQQEERVKAMQEQAAAAQPA